MEAHNSQKDTGPPGSIEEEPEFQALLTLAKRLTSDQQSALVNTLLGDMLALPPLVWDLPEVELDFPEVELDFPEVNLTDLNDLLTKAFDATPKEETDFPRIAP